MQANNDKSTNESNDAMHKLNDAFNKLLEVVVMLIDGDVIDEECYATMCDLNTPVRKVSAKIKEDFCNTIKKTRELKKLIDENYPPVELDAASNRFSMSFNLDMSNFKTDVIEILKQNNSEHSNALLEKFSKMPMTKEKLIVFEWPVANAEMLKRQTEERDELKSEAEAVAASPNGIRLRSGVSRVVEDRLTVLSDMNNNMVGLNVLDIKTSVLGDIVEEGIVNVNGGKNYLRESYMMSSLGENGGDVGKIVWSGIYDNKNAGSVTSAGVERFMVGGGSYGIYGDVTGVLINFVEKKKVNGEVKNERHIYFMGRK
jgi:hypothetical protein